MGSVQITSRDLEVLGWTADQYTVRVDVLRWRLGGDQALSESRTRSVIGRWQRGGLAECRRFFVDAPRVVWPTQLGLRLSGRQWRHRPPSLPLLAHQHAVSMVRLDLERRQAGQWVCERELYRQRRRDDQHVPDGLLLDVNGTATAVEVELTVKSADRLRDIVRDLSIDFDAVLYVAGDERVAAAVESAVRESGSEDRVRVVGLEALAVTWAGR